MVDPPPLTRTLLDSWELSMRARNLAPKTIRTYTDSAMLLAGHSGKDVGDITRDDIRAYLADLAALRAPATVSFRFRALQQWFKWLADEEEIDNNPIIGVDPPIVPEQPVPVISLEDLRAILAVCDGKGFVERRDTAVIRLFLDSGIRLAEMAGIELDDLRLREQVVVVTGKGRRDRVVPFGVKAAQALDRYLRVRVRHPRGELPNLWLGEKNKGPLTGDGIYQMVKRRADQAKVEVHPHQFRHGFAHQWLADGGNEGDLMMLAGWKSRSMLARYGASAAAERARNAHRKLSFGDQV